MMAALFVSHFTLVLVHYFSPLAAAVDVAALLSPYRNLSSFTTLLAHTPIPDDLIHRSSLTILAVPNADLPQSDLSRCSSSATSGDALSTQILLEYISPTDLRRIPPAGRAVNTLSQATGRARSGVNITVNAVTGTVSIRSVVSGAAVLSNVVAYAPNVSVFLVNSLLVPCGSSMMASESSPPLGLSITETLIGGHAFNVVTAMLAASGVADEFEGFERGAGITLFMPTDEAFAATTLGLQSLQAVEKAAVLRYHVLHSYYPLGSLLSIVNPDQPTLATESSGAGSFILNISRINGSVAISTGVVLATVTRTVFDDKPVAIFGVSRVLLPMEFFGRDRKAVQLPGGDEAAPPLGGSLPPANWTGSKNPLSPGAHPYGLGNGIRSGCLPLEVLFVMSGMVLCSLV